MESVCPSSPEPYGHVVVREQLTSGFYQEHYSCLALQKQQVTEAENRKAFSVSIDSSIMTSESELITEYEDNDSEACLVTQNSNESLKYEEIVCKEDQTRSVSPHDGTEDLSETLNDTNHLPFPDHSVAQKRSETDLNSTIECLKEITNTTEHQHIQSAHEDESDHAGTRTEIYSPRVSPRNHDVTIIDKHVSTEESQMLPDVSMSEVSERPSTTQSTDVPPLVHLQSVEQTDSPGAEDVLKNESWVLNPPSEPPALPKFSTQRSSSMDTGRNLHVWNAANTCVSPRRYDYLHH